jgi:transposase
MAIVTLGIDLAKNVFALHGVDATGQVVLTRPSVPRGKLLELVASMPPCVIAWKPDRVPTTGRACSRPTVTP